MWDFKLKKTKVILIASILWGWFAYWFVFENGVVLINEIR
jgi:hypothetical protein